jgi:uncharacterized membrane-anchored protein YhcB (DUF1043 family)
MRERIFQAVVRYGGIALVIGLILNIWAVIWHVEAYRKAARAETEVQQLAMREQALQAVAQEFAARANNDPQIAGIFKRVQAMAGLGAAPAETNRQPGAGR